MLPTMALVIAKLSSDIGVVNTCWKVVVKLKLAGVAEENVAEPEPNVTKKIGATLVVFSSEHKPADSGKRTKKRLKKLHYEQVLKKASNIRISQLEPLKPTGHKHVFVWMHVPLF